MDVSFDGRVRIANSAQLPETSGVYFFLDEDAAILYIGKATVLRDRVRSYLSSDILETRGPKIAKMLERAESIAWQKTDSVLEALLLESRLIKQHQPPYNTDAKDDKSYNHVVITEEKFPRVLLVRGRDLAEGTFTHPIRSLFGPFPYGSSLREAMKIVRKMFSYRDKCVPAETLTNASVLLKQKKKSEVGNAKERKLKPCFHRQIGLCPGVCTGEISAREYGRTIRKIELFFEGKKDVVIRKLKREMNAAAAKTAFEKAGEIRNTIFALEHIQDVALLADDQRSIANNENAIRIEAYDVAHLAGQSSVGVMVVCRGELTDKDEYRKFLLREKHFGNDLAALEEILRRRLKHNEWLKPDMIVVDGSFLQLGVAERLLGEAGWNDVRLVGVVKNRKHQPERLIGDRLAISEYRRVILLANAEAHRFAIGYHRKRREKDFIARR